MFIYQVLGYYLKHGSELAQYLEARSHAPEWSPLGLRKRLLARRKTS